MLHVLAESRICSSPVYMYCRVFALAHTYDAFDCLYLLIGLQSSTVYLFFARYVLTILADMILLCQFCSPCARVVVSSHLFWCGTHFLVLVLLCSQVAFVLVHFCSLSSCRAVKCSAAFGLLLVWLCCVPCSAGFGLALALVSCRTVQWRTGYGLLLVLL